MNIIVTDEIIELFPDAAKISFLPRKKKKALKKSLAKIMGAYIGLVMAYDEESND